MWVWVAQVIADNVGDNVGDVAGMGADLFESYVGSIIAAATLADTDARVALPFWLAGAGIVCSIIGFFAVHTKEEGAGWNSNLGALMFALEKGMYTAGGLFLGSAAVVVYVLDGLWDEVRLGDESWCKSVMRGLDAGLRITLDKVQRPIDVRFPPALFEYTIIGFPPSSQLRCDGYALVCCALQPYQSRQPGLSTCTGHR